jgi:hypothetical protein
MSCRSLDVLGPSEDCSDWSPRISLPVVKQDWSFASRRSGIPDKNVMFELLAEHRVDSLVELMTGLWTVICSRICDLYIY